MVVVVVLLSQRMRRPSGGGAHHVEDVQLTLRGGSGGSQRGPLAGS